MENKVLNTKDTTIEKLQKEGVKIGSVVFSLTTGKKYDVTMTGKIEIRPFENKDAEGNVTTTKSAYLLTKEGISPKVNGAFDAKLFAEGTTHKVLIVEQEIQGVNRKYAVLA